MDQRQRFVAALLALGLASLIVGARLAGDGGTQDVLELSAFLLLGLAIYWSASFHYPWVQIGVGLAVGVAAAAVRQATRGGGWEEMLVAMVLLGTLAGGAALWLARLNANARNP